MNAGNVSGANADVGAGAGRMSFSEDDTSAHEFYELRLMLLNRDEEAYHLNNRIEGLRRENAQLKEAVHTLLLEAKMPRAMTVEQRQRWNYYHLHKKEVSRALVDGAVEGGEGGEAGEGGEEVGSGASVSSGFSTTAEVPWRLVKRQTDAAFARVPRDEREALSYRLPETFPETP